MLLKTDSQQAFTLVETLIAVLIVGIIGTITYTVSVANGADRGKFNATVSDLSQIGQAVKVYVTNNNDYPRSSPSAGQPPDESTLPVVTANGLAQSTPFGLRAADNTNWPMAQWTGAQYDYVYLVDPIGQSDTVQVELRFGSKKPTGKWAQTMLATTGATVYYCIKAGRLNCRSTTPAPSHNDVSSPNKGICVGGDGCPDYKYQ